MSTTELFLIAMLIVFTVPFLVWRLGRTEHWAPLVVVQIITGILLGPAMLGAAFPEYYHFVFTPAVVQSLNGIAWWAVVLFVGIAGIELDLTEAWKYRRDSGITAGLALGVPLLFGCGAGALMATTPGWVGPRADFWQFVLGVGMSCAVTALPVLLLFMEKLQILRQPIGQRILRYASLDDIAIWAVLALILTDWERAGRQIAFLMAFASVAPGFRWLMTRMPGRDRWHCGLVWLIACGLGADWSGLHYMVGAFLAGAVMDAEWFDRTELDALRRHVLLIAMPVFFLSTGLRTNWALGGGAVVVGTALLLAASVGGKLIGVRIAGHLLKWPPGEAPFIGWLLQSKGLIEVIFASVLLDTQIISSETFTALLLMAVVSTMLTMPMVTPMLARVREMLERPK